MQSQIAITHYNRQTVTKRLIFIFNATEIYIKVVLLSFSNLTQKRQKKD